MIYLNPKNIKMENYFELNESDKNDIDILSEGVTINKNPPEEFYKIAENILNNLDNKFEKRDQSLGLDNLSIKNPKKMNQNKSYLKSIEKSRDIIHKKSHIISISLNINWMVCTNKTIKEVGDIFFNAIEREGFKKSPSHKSFLKDIFSGSGTLYKDLGNNAIVIATPQLSYRTYNGVPCGFSTCKIVLKSCSLDEKTRKYLNIRESCDELFKNIELL